MKDTCAICRERFVHGKVSNERHCPVCGRIVCSDCFKYFVCKEDFEKINDEKKKALKTVFFIFYSSLITLSLAAIIIMPLIGIPEVLLIMVVFFDFAAYFGFNEWISQIIYNWSKAGVLF